MHHAPKSGMHHPSPEPSDVSVGGLKYRSKITIFSRGPVIVQAILPWYRVSIRTVIILNLVYTAVLSIYYTRVL
jgi:hypothetical protein